ncbi:MAG TPA: M28 family peptidase, partial [Casimicrobiaceae bacterium]
MRQRLIALFAILLPALAGCAREAGLFSEQNARAHVEMLAGTIGSRPIGTDANTRARAYLIDQLKLYGLDVRVQEADARRATLGRTAHVSNIIATLPGTRPEALGLLAHYDSSPQAPGAADDGLGVAVVLETARVLAARQNRQWTTYVMLTDGEESGLMGAAALMTDRTITDHLKAYINIEAVGAGGPAMLFETGPGNGWLVGPWARRAPHPRGGSYSVEIYRRLPNDTDFSILKLQEIPGLNFAAVGDSHAYHTARDTPERLSPATLRDTGENVVAIATAFDGVDITRRSTGEATYFDIGSTSALSYGPVAGWALALLSIVAGGLAWVRVVRAAIRIEGTGRWLLTFVWTLLGAAVVVAAMVGATWALRASREVYHPWYASPNRLMALLVTVGASLGWGIARLGRWLPARAHGVRHPIVTWSITLPAWIALALVTLWYAPSAAYLWTLPLLAAGALLLIVPPASGAGIRAASVLVLAVTATLWLRETVELFRFAVAVFGRLPIVTPAFAYGALLAAAGLMIVPPLVAAIGASRPVLRPSVLTVACLLAV